MSSNGNNGNALKQGKSGHDWVQYAIIILLAWYPLVAMFGGRSRSTDQRVATVEAKCNQQTATVLEMHKSQADIISRLGHIEGMTEVVYDIIVGKKFTKNGRGVVANDTLTHRN